jgi:hypothetical protein
MGQSPARVGATVVDETAATRITARTRAKMKAWDDGVMGLMLEYILLS